MCGLENDDALHKFIDIVRRRIDAAYELGVTQGVEEWIMGDSTHAPKDAASIAYHEAVDATAARYMEILAKQESK
jgi:hypothetical protein